jgi:hypothetical protein
MNPTDSDLAKARELWQRAAALSERPELFESEWMPIAEALADVRAATQQDLDCLLQVAVEAIRLVHGSQLGDHYSHEPCGECGLGGEGALREALTKALGVGYTGLLWGKDMNADWPRLRGALERARE